MNITNRTFFWFLFFCAMFASCKSKEIVSYPGALKKHKVQTNVKWNKEFPTLRDSSYMIWKKYNALFYNSELINEDSLKLVKTLFIQEYKIYTEDLRKDGFAQSIINYLKPCQDSAVLLVFPSHNKNSWTQQLRRNNKSNKWEYGSYYGLNATLEKVENVLKDKNNTLFYLVLITKTNYKEWFLVYINRKGQLMQITASEPDRLFENIFKGNIKYF